MKPVMQKRLMKKGPDGDFEQRGDCLPACLATIFRIPLENIPHFNEFHDWFGSLIMWLNGKGYALWQHEHALSYPVAPLCVVSGRSPRDPEERHSVVGRGITRPTVDGPTWELVHDPHPDGTSILGDAESFWYFIALDPGTCR